MIAEVRLWGRLIGAVTWDDARGYAAFQYAPDFARSGIELSPIAMPLSDRVYVFPELPAKTFYGLPGLLADSLPDKFGNALIDAWLATQGRTPERFNAVERLCYTGTRGMGALEFSPVLGPKPQKATKVSIDALVELASEVLTHRNNLQGSFADPKKEKALTDILKVGTSAGGARAKAVIAWNRETNEVRSGQISAGNVVMRGDELPRGEDPEVVLPDDVVDEADDALSARFRVEALDGVQHGPQVGPPGDDV